MLKTPQIDALPKGFNYITGIGKPTIKKLEKEGIFQYSLFDKEIHEISHNDIRYITGFIATSDKKVDSSF